MAIHYNLKKWELNKPSDEEKRSCTDLESNAHDY